MCCEFWRATRIFHVFSISWCKGNHGKDFRSVRIRDNGRENPSFLSQVPPAQPEVYPGLIIFLILSAPVHQGWMLNLQIVTMRLCLIFFGVFFQVFAGVWALFADGYVQLSECFSPALPGPHTVWSHQGHDRDSGLSHDFPGHWWMTLLLNVFAGLLWIIPSSQFLCLLLKVGPCGEVLLCPVSGIVLFDWMDCENPCQSWSL